MSVDISAQQRQILLGSGQNPDLIQGPQLQAVQQRSSVEDLQGQQRSAIGSFFEDPQRQQEINSQVQSQLDFSLAGIGQQAADQERQSRFAAAERGNLGGSTILDQQAGIQAQAQQGVLGATGAAESQRFGLQQQLQNQQQQELLRAFQQPSAFQASEQGLLGSIGQQQQGVQQSQQLQQQHLQNRQFANDEFSRAIGGTLSNIGNVVQQRQGASQQQGTNDLLRQLLQQGGNQFSGGGF